MALGRIGRIEFKQSFGLPSDSVWAESQLRAGHGATAGR